MREERVEIKIKVIKEHEDGSADAVVHFDTEGLELLVQEGMLSILKDYIEQNKNAQEGQKLRKKLAKKAKKKDIDIDGRC
jgi:hypothetical protein